MALYLVKAKPKKDRLDNLHKELSSGIISKMRPFGHSLQHSLENARIDSDVALWIEEDSNSLGTETDDFDGFSFLISEVTCDTDTCGQQIYYKYRTVHLLKPNILSSLLHPYSESDSNTFAKKRR